MQKKIKQSKPIRFITIEGGEGAGKSTLIDRLHKALLKKKYSVLVTRAPGGTALGAEIRYTLLKNEKIPIGPLAELLQFLSDRAQQIEEEIGPALTTGKIVICDRFNDSTVAYQGYARGLGFKFVQDLCEKICGDVLPDLTFYLDLDPKKGFERAHLENRVLDRIEKEKIEFHKKVREGFLSLAAKDKKRIVTLDASKSPEEVFEQALKELDKRLTKSGQRGREKSTSSTKSTKSTKKIP